MISIKDKKILLIGGAGFIGHNLALFLKKQGANVTVTDGLQVNNLLYLNSTNEDIVNRKLYVNFINERLRLLKENDIPLFVEDARDYHKLSKITREVKPQVVILLAAVSHANRSNKDPFSTFDHSFRTLENALDCSKGRVEHFIYFSSSMIYGHFPSGSVSEETECNPLGIYGALKFGGEKLVIAYNQVFNLPYTIIRPSALYGERCISRRVGQIFIENVLSGKEIIVQGDGSDRLDFTFIGDLVRGIKNVIENENSINQVFNLTYGESRSIAQMAEIVKNHFTNVNVKYIPKDNLTPDRGTLSVEKARKLINYNPEFPLEKGFVEYIKWYKENYERMK